MKPPFQVKNKVVCIIGGGGLIGASLVDSFSDQGAHVFVGTRAPGKYRVKRKNVKYLKIDITSSRSIKDFINDVIRLKKRIDIWINAAWPRIENSVGRIEDISSDIVALDTMNHLVGYYRCCREILIQMKKFKRGVIINFGSIYGDLSPDFRIYRDTNLFISPAYPLNKGGIHTFTKYLACYAARYNIRVNAVCPGGVLNKHSRSFQKQYSNRIPLGRMARPSEIVGPVLFLASDASSYVTGHLLYVDGGLHAW